MFMEYCDYFSFKRDRQVKALIPSKPTVYLNKLGICLLCRKTVYSYIFRK